MKSRKLIGIISVVIGVVLSLSLLLLNIIQNRQITPVYVTSKTVAAGAYLTEDNVEKTTILTKDKHADYITKAEDIIGKVATVDLVANDILSTSKVGEVAENTDNQFLSIPSGKQAISFAVSGGADSLSNKLKVGDIIRIYNYQTSTGEVVSPESLQYVRVASITSSAYQDVTGNGNDVTKQSQTTSEESTPSYSTITVIVYTEQAQDIIKVQKNGGAYVSLISRGNADLAQELLDRQESILNG